MFIANQLPKSWFPSSHPMGRGQGEGAVCSLRGCRINPAFRLTRLSM